MEILFKLHGEYIGNIWSIENETLTPSISFQTM